MTGNCNAEWPVGLAFCANFSAPPTPGASGPPPARPHQPAPAAGGNSPWVWIAVGIACCCFCFCGVFAAILFPVFRAARIAAEDTIQLSQAKQVNLALLMYVNEHKGKFPPLGDPSKTLELLRPYLSDPKVLASMANDQWNQELSGKSEDSISDPETRWTFHSIAPDPSGRFDVAFADGHVKQFSRALLDSITAPESTHSAKGSSSP